MNGYEVIFAPLRGREGNINNNDSLKGKNGKVRVMYVRKEEEQQQARR